MNQNQPVMKRIIRNLFLISLICSIPIAVASGQEEKNEKKIKVIVDDGTGAKTVLDTVLTGTSLPETIEMKDGNVIFIGEPKIGLKHVSNGKKVIVSIEADENGEKLKEEKVIVMSSDSAKWTVSSAGDKGHIYVYSHDKSIGGNPEKHIIVASSGDKMGEWEGEKTIIIKDGKVVKEDGEDFLVETDESIDATKYVIAKDGVVVTVESDDEEKAKEIISLIEGKLGVKSEDIVKKEATKSETKKAEKK